MANREWDLTSENSLQGAVEWLRKKSDALMVVVIRVDDLAVSADLALAPREVQHLYEDRLPALHARLEHERAEARRKAEKKFAKGKA